MASVSHNPAFTDSPPDELPASTVRLKMEVAARAMSTDELMATLEVVAIDLERGGLGDVERFNAEERQHVLETELHQRITIFSMPESKAAKLAQDREAWNRLAREVRQRVDVADVLGLLGYPPRMIGRELHGPCPACRDGDDRLVVWPAPESRCWCRRCGLRGDVIAIVRGFMPGMAGFRDATAWLANLASLEVRS